ncbi:MAG: DNA polymerase III subunit psi [Saprospiraceae bacterium]|nr:DNA polymerase III subunit psi [Saprospiraceae bacterium]|tara:strand:- start:12669 stop:13115 length:447 start_codon:yes stop_codon:yes gene_type:complete
MHLSFYNFKRYDIIENSIEIEHKVHWKNDASTLVIVTSDYQNPELKILLHKILNAINCSEENTCLIELQETHRLKLIDLTQYHSAHSIICIGLKPLELGLNIEANLFHKKSLLNKSMLFSPSLSELEQNLDYKKMLWAELKNHFTIET